MSPKNDELSPPVHSNHKESGLIDSESNLPLPNEYDNAPNLNHFDEMKNNSASNLSKGGESEGKKPRTNSGGLSLNAVRYSCLEENVNSPLSKSQKI